MIDAHLSQDALEAYVIGALDEGELARVEAHVSACSACESRLQREASLELAFAHVASHVVEERPRRATRFAAPVAAVSGVLALAAAMLLWLAPHAEMDARSPGEPSPAAQETSGDASTATAQLDVAGDGAARAAFRD